MAASTCLGQSIGKLQSFSSDTLLKDRPQPVSAAPLPSFEGLRRKLSLRVSQEAPPASRSSPSRPAVTCGLGDFIHSDLIGFGVDRWLEEIEKYGSVGFYAPPEGGAEGRYATTLKNNGYRLMNISARGLGDPEAYLTKVHGVRPPHLGKQAVARWYFPPEVDYRLSLIHPEDKGLVVWVGEAKVLAKNELQFLALLPALRPRVKVVCEMGSARKFGWKPLKEICGLPLSAAIVAAVAEPSTTPLPKAESPVPELVPLNTSN